MTASPLPSETERRVIGIDPGVTGALVVLEAGQAIRLDDAPTVRLENKRRDFDVAGMRDLLLIARGPGRCVAVIEAVHGRPGFDMHSANSLVRGAGLWEGLCAGLGIPVRRVSPVAWKRHAQLLKTAKGHSRVRASQQFPTADLGPRSTTGRADALLIAAYGAAMAY